MRLRRVPERRFVLLLHFLLVDIIRASRSVAETAARKDCHDVILSVSQRHSAAETTTTLTSVDIADRGSVSSIVEAVIDHPKRKSDAFRPSVHLGAIEEPIARASNPFNSVQHVNFGDDAQRESQYVHRDEYRDVSSLLDEATRSSRIRFQDETNVAAMPSIPHLDDRPIDVTAENASRTPLDGLAAVGHVYVDQSFFQMAEKPAEMYDASTVLGQTTDDHRSNGAYLEEVPAKSPYIVGYYGSAHQPQEQHWDQSRPASHGIVFQVPIHRPAGSKGVLLLQQQESTYTRKHKFPYQFYLPIGGEEHHHDAQEEQRHPTMIYPPAKRMSPWKKIAQLIGTFLPLGLLLATLTPNVVRINSTSSQPSIILSKLRAVDLPLEHKRARALDDDDSERGCEDRSICEMILAGGEPQSDILRNILWNLATRTPDDIVKRNGLREVFSAVKKKDCTTIGC